MKHVHVETLRQRAQRLRLIRAREPIAARQRNRDAYAHSVGDLKHRLTVRLTDEHVAHLNEIANASGLKRNEVMRRLLLSQEIPSAEERRDIQQCCVRRHLHGPWSQLRHPRKQT